MTVNMLNKIKTSNQLISIDGQDSFYSFFFLKSERNFVQLQESISAFIVLPFEYRISNISETKKFNENKRFCNCCLQMNNAILKKCKKKKKKIPEVL